MYFRSQEDGRCLQGLVRPPVTFVKKECADLFSAHFSSISPFKEGRVQRRPFKLGLLVCSHTGLAPQHAATAHRHQMFYTAHQTRLRERGFTFYFIYLFFLRREEAGRLARAAKATTLIPFCCHCGTANTGEGRHCFRSCSEGKNIYK